VLVTVTVTVTRYLPVVLVPFACERSWANEMRHTSISALHAPGRDEGSGCRSHLPPVTAAKLTPDMNRVESRMGIGMRIAALPGSGGDRAKCTGSGRVGAFVRCCRCSPALSIATLQAAWWLRKRCRSCHLLVTVQQTIACQHG
jgi:hypothetical protein